MVDALPLKTGFNEFSAGYYDWEHPLAFTLGVPTGAEVGNLMIASIQTYDKTTLVSPGRGMNELFRYEVEGGWCYGVWAGQWDGDRTPIAWSGSGFFSGTGQFFAAFVATYADRLDPARPLVKADGPTVPGLPSSGPALCITWVRGGIGGVGGFDSFAGTDWTIDGTANGSYVLGTIASNGGEIPDQTATDVNANWGPYMSFGVLGRNVAPPCRLTSREDHLGVGAGRVWPPAKSQQSSPRTAATYY